MRLCREAHWRYPSGPHARFRCGTKFENGDAPFCNSDSTAAAYATARQCSESTARLQGSDASGSAYGPGVLRRCSLPENDLGYVPIANRLAESFDIYSRSTPSSNFEIGSSHSLEVPLQYPVDPEFEDYKRNPYSKFRLTLGSGLIKSTIRE